jgi:hypothetical protein
MMHGHEWDLEQAMEYCVVAAPHGELLAGSHHLYFVSRLRFGTSIDCSVWLPISMPNYTALPYIYQYDLTQQLDTFCVSRSWKQLCVGLAITC